MSSEVYSESIQLNNVRISFPFLLRPQRSADGADPKYSATFILDEKIHVDVIKKLESMIEQVSQERFKRVLPRDKWCLKERDRDEYEGAITIGCTNHKKPAVMKADCSKVESEEDNPIYAGCYVNALIQVGTFNKGTNKGIRANVQGVQFYAHGKPFAGGMTESEVMEQFNPVVTDDDASFMQAS